MKKVILFCFFMSFALEGKGQDSIVSINFLDFYLRGGGVSEWYNGEGSSHFQLDEARLHFYGWYNESLSYQIRFRLNKPFVATSLDNGSTALDHLGYIVNPFLAGVRLDVGLNDTQYVGVQLHNTVNNSFEKHLESNGFSKGAFSVSKMPIGAYLYWRGKFMEGKFCTHYSYNISQFAKGYYSHSLSFGHRYKSDRHSAYLDFMFAKMGADYPLLGSRIMSNYEGLDFGSYLMREDITYKGVVGRYEYLFNNRWKATVKAGAESVTSSKGLRGDLRYNYIYSLAFLYSPIENQDLQCYVAYAGNSINYPSKVGLDRADYQSILVGAYYSLPLLRNMKIRR